MIAIDVTMTATNEQMDNSLDYHASFINSNYSKVFAFFRRCVDRGLVLNFIDNVQDADANTDVTTYYSITMENAQVFEQKFQDLSSEFSLRKMWNEAGFETSISMKEIDFNYVEDPTHPEAFKKTVLVDEENSTIWGIQFPY
jgi:superfamily II helicase